MRIDDSKRRKMPWWIFVGAMFALCAVLGALQYRWIGEASIADRDRMRRSLKASLERIS